MSSPASFAARVRGLLTIPRLIQRLEQIQSDAKGDSAQLTEETTKKLQALLADLRGKDEKQVMGPYLTEDLDAYESVVKQIEDHVAHEQTVKMVSNAMNR